MQTVDEQREFRLKICKECPLYKETEYGAVCNRSKYISKDGKDWSWMKKSGYVPGCGCHINNIVNNPNKSCVVNKW
jgi:hypothetical protein